MVPPKVFTCPIITKVKFVTAVKFHYREQSDTFGGIIYFAGDGTLEYRVLNSTPLDIHCCRLPRVLTRCVVTF